MTIGNTPARVLYIIVNYKKAALCLELAKSILAQPGSDSVHIMIVDNSETELDSKMLSESPTARNVSIFTPRKNLGFYGGAQAGLASYIERLGVPDWTIVSNPDIDFPDGNFFTLLLTRPQIPNLGVIAPDIRMTPVQSGWQGGAPQNPMTESRPSKMRLRQLELLCRFPFLYWMLELRRWLRMNARPRHLKQAARARKIYAAHGSATIFAKEYFSRGGNLRHELFLYGEELFVAEELLLLGLTCWFEPELKLSHIGGATTGALGTTAQRRYAYEALRFIRKRYFSGASAVN